MQTIPNISILQLLLLNLAQKLSEKYLRGRLGVLELITGILQSHKWPRLVEQDFPALYISSLISSPHTPLAPGSQGILIQNGGGTEGKLCKGRGKSAKLPPMFYEIRIIYFLRSIWQLIDVGETEMFCSAFFCPRQMGEGQKEAHKVQSVSGS